MRKSREVLRLHFECGCQHRQIALACEMSPSAVSDYLSRAERAGLTWEQARPLSNAEVEAKLFSYVGRSDVSEPETRATIDFNWVHAERGRVGVTLQLLWGEYQGAAKQRGARPYQYSQFCELARSAPTQHAASPPARLAGLVHENPDVALDDRGSRYYDAAAAQYREIAVRKAPSSRANSSNYAFHKSSDIGRTDSTARAASSAFVYVLSFTTISYSFSSSGSSRMRSTSSSNASSLVGCSERRGLCDDGGGTELANRMSAM